MIGGRDDDQEQFKKVKLSLSFPVGGGGGGGQRKEGDELIEQSRLDTQKSPLFFYPNFPTFQHSGQILPQAWFNGVADPSNRFILYRSKTLNDDMMASFRHPDEEIEYSVLSYTALFIARKKNGAKINVAIECAPGRLEAVLEEWAAANGRRRDDISDVIWKKVVFFHSIYDKHTFEFELADILVVDTSIEPMYGVHCIRRENKSVNLYVDVTLFGPRMDLRPLYTRTVDNVVYEAQKLILEDMEVLDTSFGNILPPRLYDLFFLHLEEHQKHSVRWMNILEERFYEKGQIPKDWWLDTYEFIKHPHYGPFKLLHYFKGDVVDTYPSNPSYYSRGGVLASGKGSKPGSGKTIVALALIASRVVPDLDVIHSRIPFTEDREGRLPSRATLILVPGHLIDHWMEAIGKAFKTPKNVIKIASKEDYATVSWIRIMLADIVLLSMSFYMGGPYMHIIADRREDKDQILYMDGLMKDPKKDEILQIPGNVLFRGFYFNRVIVDELDGNAMILDLKGNFHWALSSQPKWDKEDIEFAAKFVDPFTNFFFKGAKVETDTNLADRLVKHISFKKNFMKSLTGALVLPDIQEQVVPVRWALHNDFTLNPIGKTILGAQEAASLLSMSLDDEIQDLTQVVIQDLAMIPEIQGRFADVDLLTIPEGASVFIKGVLARIVEEVESKSCKSAPIPVNFLIQMGKLKVAQAIKDRYKKVQTCDCTMEIDSLEMEKKSLSTFITESLSFKRLWSKEQLKIRLIQVMNTILDSDQLIECQVCKEDLCDQEKTLIITDCFHVYDSDCFKPLCNQKKPSCAVCRAPISLKRCTEFSMNGQFAGPVDLEAYNFTSEIRNTLVAVVKELESIIRSQMAKVVVFTHDSRLAPELERVMSLLGISTVRLTKKIEDREVSIWRFKKGASQALIMSCDSDIAGLDLHIATHLLIVEDCNKPSSPEEDKYVVSRVYRMGLKHPLVVLRFRQ